MARVLVVEDESTSRRAVKVVLARNGHEVQAVGSGREAEEALRYFNPEVAVIDWLLPDGNGDVLAQQLRSSLGQPLGVVFITGLSGHDLQRRLESLEPCVLLRKPFDLARLLEAIARFSGSALLERRQTPLSPSVPVSRQTGR